MVSMEIDHSNPYIHSTTVLCNIGGSIPFTNFWEALAPFAPASYAYASGWLIY